MAAKKSAPEHDLLVMPFYRKPKCRWCRTEVVVVRVSAMSDRTNIAKVVRQAKEARHSNVLQEVKIPVFGYVNLESLSGAGNVVKLRMRSRSLQGFSCFWVGYRRVDGGEEERTST